MKLEFINYLLSEVDKELNKTKAYKEECERVDRILAKNLNLNRWREFNCKIVPGSNAKVKEYLKTVRRISLEIEKEL